MDITLSIYISYGIHRTHVRHMDMRHMYGGGWGALWASVEKERFHSHLVEYAGCVVCLYNYSVDFLH